MKINEAITLYQAVNALLQNPAPKANKLTWTLHRNARVLAGVAEDFQKQITSEAEANPDRMAVLKQYDAAKYELVKEYAILNTTTGEPLAANGRYVFSDVQVWELAHSKMLEEHPDFAEALRERDVLANEVLQMDCEVTVNKVAFESLPENLDTALLQALEPMLYDPVD